MNPLDVIGNVEERYFRYLETRYAFKDRDLQEQFAERLRAGRLTKGPYIELVGAFRRGAECKDVVREALGNRADRGFLEALEGDRELYSHQEEAIRRAAMQERNVIVATGTGSGKTEAFLLPILIHLYREYLAGTLDRSGVRALIVYPMNALANDQRERLGEITSALARSSSDFGFTFGQYTGGTPKDEGDARRDAQSKLAGRIPGELVLRSEMQESPPHVLLTNFSMLEYLMIRPQDSPLFDGSRSATWKYVVLDEAHQYNGALGIEVGMLIRRLRARLQMAGHDGSLCCIGTSATISSGEDRSSVVEFASSLFNAPFEEDDIILGDHELPVEDPNLKLSVRQIDDLYSGWSDGNAEAIRQTACDASVAQSTEAPNEVLLGSILKSEESFIRLQRTLEQGPRMFSDLADELFESAPRDRRQDLLRELVSLACAALDPSTGKALVSLRYHHFLRTLEGCFLSYAPRQEGWAIRLDRAAADPGLPIYELALCTECGQHFMVGKCVGGKLLEAVRDTGDPDYGAEYFVPVDPTAVPTTSDADSDEPVFVLRGLTGDMQPVDAQTASIGVSDLLVKRAKSSPSDELRTTRCPSCNFRGTDPVRSIRPGKAGPHVVIASSLHASLPVDRRRILAFADSRRDAAVFAWDLDDSHQSITSRVILLQAARELMEVDQEPPALADLIPAVTVYRERAGFVPEYLTAKKAKRDAWVQVYREFLTPQRRISLAGTGLVSWEVLLPRALRVPQGLLESPWNLDEEEAKKVLRMLLESMREQGGVELTQPEKDPVAWDELEMLGGQISLRIGDKSTNSSKGRHRIESWDTPNGRRVALLMKILARKDSSIPSEQVEELCLHAVRAAWETFCDEPSGGKGLLVRCKDALRMNPEWWRCRALCDSDEIFICNTCGKIHSYDVEGVCTRYGCSGTLRPCLASETWRNHYTDLYQSSQPLRLRVEEHTAQIAKETARRFQKEFREGDIDVLSSSTTFELGVDLGDLDVVFMRNVPPEVFNYAQRAGRAGRRAGRPGLVFTYCGRSSHDLYHFADPGKKILSGAYSPPVIQIENQKIVSRHMTATALSCYFRANPERFSNAEAFLGSLANPDLTTKLGTFLAENRSAIEVELSQAVPPDLLHPLGVTDGSWIQKATCEGSMLARAQEQLQSDYLDLREYEQDSVARRVYADAKWANQRAETMQRDDVLSVLSRKAVIPKYGFPVDVVELDLGQTDPSAQANTVELQRDLSLAIAEFAPQSEVVANKAVWESIALKRLRGKEWDMGHYRQCRFHKTLQVWTKADPSPPEPCCKYAVEGTYIKPAFGFVGRQKKEGSGVSRMRHYATRPAFVRMISDDVQVNHYGSFSLTKAAPGRMVVLCRGARGGEFFVCSECGRSFAAKKSKHSTSYGAQCGGTLVRAALGHDFETDVVRFEFHIPVPQVGTLDAWMGHSVAYAILQGAATALNVPPGNLDVTVNGMPTSEYPDIVLYDNVPGGAGLVAQLSKTEVLLTCLQAAQDRVNGQCGCDDLQSCYGCLRSYRNQFAHRNLVRGPAREYLEGVLSGFDSD